MRSDMYKVIVERPRSGSRAENADVRRERNRGKVDDVDDLPSRIPMKPKFGHTKNLNENLSPLRRFLFSNVGRPWDKVYSEISQHIKPGNTVQEHVRDHIFDYVERNTVLIDNKVYYLLEYSSTYTSVDEGRRFSRMPFLYVHPKTGILCQSKAPLESRKKIRAKREAEKAARQVKVNKHLRFILITPKDKRGNDLPPVWFRVIFADLHAGLFRERETVGFENGKPKTFYTQVYVGESAPYILKGTDLEWDDRQYYYRIRGNPTSLESYRQKAQQLYGEHIYPVSAETANSRDIRKYKLGL